MKKIINYINESIRLPLMVGLMLLITGHAIGQREEPLNPKFKNIAKPESTKGWLDFREGAIKNPTTIFEDLKDAFELSGDDKMIIKKTKKDNIGFTHYRYQQYYKNRRVIYGEYIVHQRSDGLVKSANGRIIDGLRLGNNASVNEKDALESALRFMGATKYLWQNSIMENELKRQQKNVNSTYYPNGELVYSPGKFEDTLHASTYRLAWQFKIYTDDSKVAGKTVYVDAITGKVIYYTNISINCTANTSSSTFNGTVRFNAEIYKITTDPYTQYLRSHNNCQSADIYVYDCKQGDAATDFYELKRTNFVISDWVPTAVQAQWGALMTYKYYDSIHSRKSWDDESGDMIAYNNANITNLGVNNACWGCNGNAAIFGAGNLGIPNDDWNTVDIMGHEFTHGVTQATAGLDYEKESGALNESFSDIFGEVIESFAYRGANCDYLVGANRNGGAIRSFINPKNFGQPDTYLGTNWFNTNGCTPDAKTNDNCGVHTNSGVQNHWFYLLSEGGSGINDKGVSYNVTGITRFKARYIVYRALLEYLTSSSDYIDARKASLKAAEDLFGSCSPEAIAVGDAWHAVGVESQSPEFIKNICGSYPSSGTFFQAISALTVANGCNTEITPSPSTVYFAARDLIVLNPGFRAENGSNFVAYLNPCSSTLYKSSGDNAFNIVMSDAEKGIKLPVINQQESPKESTAGANIFISPNPFSSTFVLSIYSKQNERAQVNIYNSIGIKVKEQIKVNLVQGVNKIPVDGIKFSKGMHTVEIIMGDIKTVKKVIKI